MITPTFMYERRASRDGCVWVSIGSSIFVFFRHSDDYALYMSCPRAVRGIFKSGLRNTIYIIAWMVVSAPFCVVATLQHICDVVTHRCQHLEARCGGFSSPVIENIILYDRRICYFGGASS
jgi:hypothetical protein